MLGQVDVNNVPQAMLASVSARELQAKLFRLMNYTDEEIQERFGHMLEAFEYGAPPHGGIAPGMDRLIAIQQAIIQWKEASFHE